MHVKRNALGILLAMMMVVIGFSSCDKNEGLLQERTPDVVSAQEEASQEETQFRSADVYYVALKYKNAYKHLMQNSGECSWTSYTLAAAAVARGEGKNYPSNLVSPTVQDYRNKIDHVKVNAGSSKITRLEDYCTNFDKPTYGLSALVESDGNLEKAARLLYEKRSAGNQKPCLFITGVNGVGHYVIVWDLIWGGDASSSFVNITDPLNSSKLNFTSYENEKDYVNLEGLMKKKPKNISYYNFLFFE